jgi:hypothetical protein
VIGNFNFGSAFGGTNQLTIDFNAPLTAATLMFATSLRSPA